MAARPIGALTKKTHSHPTYSVSTPPSSTPTAPPAPETAPHTASALLRSVALGEGRGEDRECRGRDHRGAEALNRACADQEAAGRCKAAGQRCDREDAEARHEHPATAEQVGTPAAQQQEPAERQRVGARDPLQARVGEVQIDFDRRQRDVDDRDVDDEHELRRAEQDQRDPAARIGGFRRHWLLSQEVVSQQYDPGRADVNNVRGREFISSTRDYSEPRAPSQAHRETHGHRRARRRARRDRLLGDLQHRDVCGRPLRAFAGSVRAIRRGGRRAHALRALRDAGPGDRAGRRVPRAERHLGRGRA